MTDSVMPPSKFQAGHTSGTDDGFGRCPVSSTAGARLNPLAVASFVVALFVGVLAPLTIVTAAVARGQIRKTGDAGGGLATAALIISGVYLLAGVVVVLLHAFVTTS